VLIDQAADTEVMTGFLVILALLVMCVLAPFVGADSRDYEPRGR
jgi:hypothetical protein